MDSSQQRFNDLFKLNVDSRTWEEESTVGQAPQPRTFHRAVLIQNVMYVVGGFDGSRLNDMFHIALEKSKSGSTESLSQRSSSDESVVSYKSRRPPTSAASGIMQTVPSDLSIN